MLQAKPKIGVSRSGAQLTRSTPASCSRFASSQLARLTSPRSAGGGTENRSARPGPEFCKKQDEQPGRGSVLVQLRLQPPRLHVGESAASMPMVSPRHGPCRPHSSSRR
jgi:hypothetical protein